MSRIYTNVEAIPEEVCDNESFPLHALPANMKALVENVSDVYQVEPALPAMAALATASGAIGKSITITGGADGRNTHCNLYIIAGAPKSYGKGGTSLVVNPITEASKKLIEGYTEYTRPKLKARQSLLESTIKKLKSDAMNECIEGVYNDKSLRETIAEYDKNEILIGSPPSYQVGAATGAALEQALLRNSEMIFSYSPEAGDVIRIALGRYSKDSRGDFDLYLSGYSNELYSSARISRGQTTMTPCISCLWMCQPSLLRELYGSQEALERGLMARCLVFSVEHDVVPYDDGAGLTISEDLYTKWDSTIQTILKERSTERVLQCTPEAKEVFRCLHNEFVDLRNGEYCDIEGELGRIRENAIRMAGVLQVSQVLSQGYGEKITASTATHAAEIVRWCSKQSLKLHESGRTKRLLDRMKHLTNIISEKKLITLRDLDRRHGFKRAEIELLSKRYSDIIEKDTIQPGTEGGRPSEIVKLKTT